jgi:5-methylcytosine-specific restriction endonuclease McrA
VFRNGGEPTLKMLPPSHPVVRLMAGLPAHATPRARITVVSRTVGCDWCGTEFTTRRQSQRMCSRRCKTKAFKVRRRGQANGWASHYTWAEVMRLHLALGKACAYCAEVVDGQPDPDHVVPLSRGGSNSITNILSCCGPCNSDKRDLLLGEWNADRARRKLPPRIISDPRWIHLTSTDARSADTDVAQCG